MNKDSENPIDLKLVDVYLDEIAMNIVEVVKVLIKTNEIELKADQIADQIEEKITKLVDEKITRLFENKLK